MKILQINTVCGKGSTGRICIDIAQELERQGHECKIAYGRDSVPEQYQKYAVRIGSEFGLRMNALKARLFDNEGFNAKRATKKLIQTIETYNPDIIHLHNLHGYYLNIEILFNYLKTCGKKIVWTLHDCWSFTGHCTYFDMVKCDKWKTGCQKCPQRKRYPASKCWDASKKNFTKKKKLFCGIEDFTIVTPSIWLANLVKQSYLSEYQVQVINNGINTGIFKPTTGDILDKYHVENKKIILGVASGWGKRKGLGAFEMLSGLLPQDYQIVLVGLSKKQITRLPKNIIGIERTNKPQELAMLYSAAEVFVNPTLEDNYPTTNLEAIACGTPVITYNTGGSPESARGWCCVTDNNAEALFEAICQKQFVRQDNIKIDIKDAVAQYMELYKRD